MHNSKPDPPPAPPAAWKNCAICARAIKFDGPASCSKCQLTEQFRAAINNALPERRTQQELHASIRMQNDASRQIEQARAALDATEATFKMLGDVGKPEPVPTSDGTRKIRNEDE